MEMTPREKIYYSFEYFIKNFFELDIPFDVEEHRNIPNAYVVLLPAKADGLEHIIGRQAKTLKAINIIFSAWGSRNKILVYVKQRRERKENKEQQENN